MVRRTVYFDFSSEEITCEHEINNEIAQATTTKDGRIDRICIKCKEIISSEAIPYPRTIRLSSGTFTYNGKVQKPSISVIGSNDKVIDASNYTVTYSGESKEAGKYTATITFKENYTGSVVKEYVINPAPKPQVPSVGTVLIDAGTKAAYKVTVAGKTVEYKSAPNKKVTSANVPATVKINNVTYKVTSIAPNAFKNCKKLKKVTIGSNIKTVGKQAFSGCKSLKTITVKSKSITKVGSKAFKGINKKATIKVPKTKLKAYKKLFKKGGLAKSVKIKK